MYYINVSMVNNIVCHVVGHCTMDLFTFLFNPLPLNHNNDYSSITTPNPRGETIKERKFITR